MTLSLYSLLNDTECKKKLSWEVLGVLVYSNAILVLRLGVVM